MSDPAISRTKAAMKAAARANGTAGTVKPKPEVRAARPAPSKGFLGFKDRLFVRSDGKDAKPLLVKGWQQAGLCLAGLSMIAGIGGLGLFAAQNHKSVLLNQVSQRDADVRVALELIAGQLASQQTALFDAAAMDRGLVFVDSSGMDIQTLMAENERLLSTLDAALSLTAEPLEAPQDQVASAATLQSSSTSQLPLSEDAAVLARELALTKTEKSLIEAELSIERETINQLAEELAIARQETRTLERETLRLNESLDGRDESIAILKRDIVSMQTGQTGSDEARRRAMQLLNEQNADLTAELKSLKTDLDEKVLLIKSMDARLSQFEADNTRLSTLVSTRDEQITKLTEAQNTILDQLETQVEDQMAALEKAINMTGVNQDTTVDLDALLDSASSPFWNGMGGAEDDLDTEAVEFAVSEDEATNLINGLYDRAQVVEKLVKELEAQQKLFDRFPTAQPVKGLRLSSVFGMRKHPISGKYRMHSGLDFAGPSGTRVGAAGPGKVVYAARKGGYGNLVELDHGNGLTTRYAHLRKISVKNGATVEVGQKLGEVGSTGASTGPHLHWEVRVDGQAKDPRSFLDAGTFLNRTK